MDSRLEGLSVPGARARGSMGSSSPAVHHYHLRQLRRLFRSPGGSGDARSADLATFRTAEDPALPRSVPDPGAVGAERGGREFDAIRAQLRTVESVVRALQQHVDRAAAAQVVAPWEMQREAAPQVEQSVIAGQVSAATSSPKSGETFPVDYSAPEPETDELAAEGACVDVELYDKRSEEPPYPASVEHELEPAALHFEVVVRGGDAEDSGDARGPVHDGIPTSRDARATQRPVGIKAAAEFGLTRMTIRIQGWCRRMAVHHRCYPTARRLAFTQGSSPAGVHEYREYCSACGLSEEATESILGSICQREVARKLALRRQAEQQKQADAFRRETLWLALDLRGAHAAIGKALHPRVFGAFFGWRQQYLAAKHARS